MLDFNDFRNQFCEIFKNNHLERFCTDEIITKFHQFTELLTEENSHTNLTAIREIPDIIAKHYADSLLVEPHFPQNATVMDVGCGGGFPSVPLAIARPDLKITAVDSTQKKINFVQKTIRTLHLTNLNAICARAEAPEMSKYREKFDVVTSRAMARMVVLTELTLPFVKKEGLLIALKGAQGQEELKESIHAIRLLGGSKNTQDVEFSLQTPTNSECRHVLIIQKTSTTPAQYPRNYATITKKPL